MSNGTANINLLITKAEAAKDLYTNRIRERVRSKLKEINIGEEIFGFSAADPDRTFMPSIGLHPQLSDIATTAPDIRLSILPVELLIEQSGKLLDRVLMEDAAQRAMRIAEFNLWLDLDELEALTEINDLEVEAKIDEVPLHDAQAVLDGETANVNAKVAQLNYLAANQDRQKRLAAWSTEAALRRTPIISGPTVMFGGFHSALPETAAEGKDAGPTEWLGAVVSYELAYHQLAMNWQAIEAERNTSQARIPHLQKKVEFLQKNIQFQAARRSTARLKLNRRIIEASRDDGCLNYTPRIKRSEERIVQDLIAAYHRMGAAREGLGVIYGIDMPALPAPGESLLDELVLWVRDAQDRLELCCLNDKACVLRISAKENIGADFTNKILSPAGLSFEIPFDALPNGKRVRLRGVSASIVPKAKRELEYLTLRLTPPFNAKFKHDGSAVIEREQPVTEGLLGRVRPVSSALMPDVAGTPEWHNASPFGKWTVCLPQGKKWADTVGALDDLYIDLLVVYQV